MTVTSDYASGVLPSMLQRRQSVVQILLHFVMSYQPDNRIDYMASITKIEN